MLKTDDETARPSVAVLLSLRQARIRYLRDIGHSIRLLLLQRLRPGHLETHTRSHLLHIFTYQGYDMDILSGKSYYVIYQGYDMDIPNANNL